MTRAAAVIALLLAAGCGPPLRKTPPLELFSAGLTPPVRLLAFDAERSTDPDCRRGAVIDAIAAQAHARGCAADSQALGGTPTLLITCPIAGAGDGCRSDYVAQIWQERWSSSTENYDLYLYARVRAVCAADADFQTFHASDEVNDEARRRSRELDDLLARCGGAPPPFPSPGDPR